MEDGELDSINAMHSVQEDILMPVGVLACLRVIYLHEERPRLLPDYTFRNHEGDAMAHMYRGERFEELDTVINTALAEVTERVDVKKLKDDDYNAVCDAFHLFTLTHFSNVLAGMKAGMDKISDLKAQRRAARSEQTNNA